jgi:Pyruvate/2-oxoacid:ferredoxin oxidoreductase delta subunit
MDARTLDYDHDEEALGFGEPETPEGVAPSGLSAAEKASLALVGLGLLSLGVQVFGGTLNGTWTGFLSSFGLLSVGGALTFWTQLRGSSAGIKHDGSFFHGLVNRGMPGWIAGIVMTGLYVLLYFQPRYLGYAPAIYGSEGLVEPARVTGGIVRTVEPLAHVLGVESSQWFLYGVLYTLSILVFGVRMLMKYRHSRYQQVRTGSVMFFQLVLAFVLPNVLARFNQPEHYFSYFWPLKYEYLFPESFDALMRQGRLGAFMFWWGVGMTCVATPVLTYFLGKRWYCSWVCGCGGLAETLGDPWRQLSDKSQRSWNIERWLIHAVLAFIVVTTALVWLDSRHGGGLLGGASSPVKKVYGFAIGAVFSGVIGVGFYPLLGSRVWCRFGCPMAAVLGILQRTFSRFRITTNGGQCMSCGNCSTYCEMGIDVRAYAQANENIVRASCVGCGVCAAVCPRGVLRLENGPATTERYDGRAITSLAAPDIHGYKAWEQPD